MSKAKAIAAAKVEANPTALKKVLLWAIGAVIVGTVVLFIIRFVQNIGQPQIEYSEGLMLYINRCFNSGTWSWTLPENPPFVVPFYPPVLYTIMGLVFRITGESLIAGRLIVLVCSLVSMGMVYLIVYEVTKRKLYSTIAALLPLTQVIMQGWYFYIRADVPAVMWELTGLYLVIRWTRTKNKWLPFLATLLFVVAFYTKQSALVAGASVCVALFLNSKKEGTGYALLLIAMIGGSLFIFNKIYPGFFDMLITYQRTSPMMRDLNTASMYWYVVLIPLIPVMLLAFQFIGKNKYHLLSIFALLALAINTVAVIRPGAGHSYFMETIFAMSICAGCGLQVLMESKKDVFLNILAFVITVLTLVFNQAIVIYPDKDYKVRTQEVAAIISDATYPVLTENWSVVLDAGKEPYYDSFVFYHLSQLELWDNKKILEDLRTNKIEYCVLQSKVPEQRVQRLGDQEQRFISEYYHIILDYSNYTYGFVVYEANNRE